MLPYYHSIHTLHWLPQTAPSHFIVYCNPPALPIKNWSSYLSYIHPILFIIKFIAPTLSSLSINMVTSSVCFSSSKMTQSLPVKAKDPPGQQLRKWLIRKLTILLNWAPQSHQQWLLVMRRLSPSFPLYQWLWLHLPKTYSDYLKSAPFFFPFFLKARLYSTLGCRI